MKKYKCKVCGYIYDPEAGESRSDTAPGTPFEDLKSNWTMSSVWCRNKQIHAKIILR